MAAVPGFDPTLISETEVSGIADPERRRKQDGGGDTQRQQASHGDEFSGSRSAFPLLRLRATWGRGSGIVPSGGRRARGGGRRCRDTSSVRLRSCPARTSGGR